MGLTAGSGVRNQGYALRMRPTDSFCTGFVDPVAMTFEHHARQRIGLQPNHELDRFTNGHGIGDPGLNASPMPDHRLQDFAEEELARREQERKAAIDDQLDDDPFGDLIDDL